MKNAVQVLQCVCLAYQVQTIIVFIMQAITLASIPVHLDSIQIHQFVPIVSLLAFIVIVLIIVQAALMEHGCIRQIILVWEYALLDFIMTLLEYVWPVYLHA